MLSSCFQLNTRSSHLMNDKRKPTLLTFPFIASPYYTMYYLRSTHNFTIFPIRLATYQIQFDNVYAVHTYIYVCRLKWFFFFFRKRYFLIKTNVSYLNGDKCIFPTRRRSENPAGDFHTFGPIKRDEKRSTGLRGICITEKNTHEACEKIKLKIIQINNVKGRPYLNIN